jgi:alpha-glucosidase
VATRYGGVERARATLVMLYALRGTPFIYQGEELGLPDAVIPPDRVVDVDGRDPERTPIPWLPGPGAGFTTGEPWLPLHPDADALNVQRQAADPDSTLSLTRRLGALRAASPALQVGTRTPVDAGPDVLAWLREAGEERILAAVNFGDAPAEIEAPGELLLSSDPGRPPGSPTTLAPGEAVLVRRV